MKKLKYLETRIQILSATHLYLVEKVRCIRIIRLFQLAIGKHTMKQYTQLSQEGRKIRNLCCFEK